MDDKTLTKPLEIGAQKAEEKKPANTKAWFYVITGIIVIGLLILALTKVINWGWFFGLLSVVLVIFFLVLLFVILKLGKVNLGEKEILLKSGEIEDFVEEYMKVRYGIQLGEMRTTLPHNIGVPPTKFALILSYDDLDARRRQLAILVRMDKRDMDPSVLYRPYDMDARTWAREIQKLKEEMADKLSPSIIKSFRTYGPAGISESEERIPAELQEALEKRQKEAEKV